MATLLEHAINLRNRYQTQRVYLPAMAKVFWPDADWLSVKIGHNNGGARKGARLAGGLAGRMAQKGFLKLDLDAEGTGASTTAYRVCPEAIDAAIAAAKENK